MSQSSTYPPNGKTVVRKDIEDSMTEPDVDRVNRMANDRLSLLKYADTQPSRDESDRRF